jgi:hypothetical protein
MYLAAHTRTHAHTYLKNNAFIYVIIYVIFLPLNNQLICLLNKNNIRIILSLCKELSVIVIWRFQRNASRPWRITRKGEIILDLRHRYHISRRFVRPLYLRALLSLLSRHKNTCLRWHVKCGCIDLQRYAHMRCMPCKGSEMIIKTVMQWKSGAKNPIRLLARLVHAVRRDAVICSCNIFSIARGTWNQIWLIIHHFNHKAKRS